MSEGPIVVWGEVLWDVFADGSRLGGAPANVAWHLGQMGAWVALATRVGRDALGARAAQELAAWVDTGLVQYDDARATGEVNVTTDHAGEPSYVLHAGRAWECIEFTDDVAAALADAPAVIYGTLAQRTPAGLASWRRAMAAAPPGCMRVCDPNLRTHSALTQHERTALAEALALADVIKLNEHECARIAVEFGCDNVCAALLGAVPAPWLSTTAAAPHATPRVGAQPEKTRVVALTRGAQGATLFHYDGKQTHALTIAPHPARPGGDQVGCGDAFVAALTFGLLEGLDLVASGDAASAWAAEVASAVGATPLVDAERLDDLLPARWTS